MTQQRRQQRRPTTSAPKMVKRVVAALIAVMLAGVLLASFAATTGSSSSGDKAGRSGCQTFTAAVQSSQQTSTAQAEAVARVQAATRNLLKSKDPTLARAATNFAAALDSDASQATVTGDAQAVVDRCVALGY